MYSFSTLYDRIVSKPELWNYYRQNNLKLEDKNDVYQCADFINQFLKDGEKANIEIVKDGLEWLEKHDRRRLKHTVSTFFLGIMIYTKSKYVKKNIDNVIRSFIEEGKTCEHEFMYLWFMFTLFHDLGYQYDFAPYENPQKPFKLLFDLRDEYEKKKEANDISGLNDFVPNILIEKCNAYLEYRKGCDHGIIIGSLLYEQLRKNREFWKNQPDGERPNLSFEDKLDILFYQIASVITVHNMWFKCKCNENNENPNKIDCDSEGIPLKYPIPSKEYPFLFLFDLVDTIEPMKQTSILPKELKFSIQNKKIRIESNDAKYIQTLVDMNTWLTKVDSIKLMKKSIVEIHLCNDKDEKR